MFCCLILPNGLNGQFNLQDYGGNVSMSFKAGSDFIMLNVEFKNVLPLNFIFDTGSEHTILFKKEYADLLGVTYDKRIPLMGSDLSKEIYGYIARGIQLNLDNKYQTVSDVLVLEEDYLRLEEFTGINIDGILGANIFRHFVVHVSNRRNKVRFIDIASFNPPNRYEAIDISVFKNKPYIMAQALLGPDHIPLKLLIDTGAGLPVLLYTNTHPSLHLPEETLKGNLGRGLGGQLEGYIGRLDGFSFHEYNFSGIISSFQEISIEHTEVRELNRNGIFGNGILRRFDYYIDYAAEKLYVKTNRRFKRKFKFDKSGLIVIATGRQLRDFVIQGVRDDTPAKEADIRQGDFLVKIEGISTNLKTLSSINAILSSKIGRKVTMVIARGDERLKKKIKLREII
ncbi:MAG: PDZ domain-containing protein [Saprospiraceae bacterium]|nr:PDZ domain-containing protein [Saprospiraceae bacterium]